ncbi:hypothetical protein EKE94_06570 [Mesobaculum littorinae]|uniref:Sulfotransferase family protein n=1 Tax=Mesobaculum littorinae TaxID=2486419 RepID=A0A438AIT7_9RHOB|nr:hypothetical protein [Mesobaculum littorinae]RVV98574.1 hypothetical protein EKE94_06570 [Mesobaculum littorinae]
MDRPNPIIVLWSHPRSMSTATERLMRERGDLDCLHEPFMYDYYVHRQVRRFPHFEPQPDHPRSYDDIRAMLLDRAAAGPVFLKDMAYYVVPRILEDPELLQRMRHAFLIRDPAAALASYYRIDPDLTCEEVGLEAQWRLFRGLRDRGLDAPVVRAEDVRGAPERVIGALWQRLGLQYVASAFDWSEAPPEDWAQVGDWHGQAESSTGIKPVSEAERAKKARQFEEAAQTSPRLRDLLAHHQPFHDRLAAHALTG